MRLPKEKLILKARKSTREVLERKTGREGPFSALVDIYVIVRNRWLHSAVVISVRSCHVRVASTAERRTERAAVETKFATLGQIHACKSEVQAFQIVVRSRVSRRGQLPLATLESKRLGFESERVAGRVRLTSEMSSGARRMTHRNGPSARPFAGTTKGGGFGRKGLEARAKGGICARESDGAGFIERGLGRKLSLLSGRTKRPLLGLAERPLLGRNRTRWGRASGTKRLRWRKWLRHLEPALVSAKSIPVGRERALLLVKLGARKAASSLLALLVSVPALLAGVRTPSGT